MKWRVELASLAARFHANTDGSVAVIFALCLMSLLVSAGLAIDFGRSASLRTSLQNDLDAAILGAAVNETELSAIRTAAEKHLKDNWAAKYEIEAATVTLTVEKPTETTIAGAAQVRVPTTLMALAGISNVDVRVTSQIELASENVELALVLDVTDSMAGAKIEALKTSANSLIDKAYANEKSAEHVKVAIVPFADYVNVGDINRNASWISVPLDSEEVRETCIDNYREVTGTSNCRTVPYTYDRDGVSVTVDTQVCDYEYGPPQNRCFTNTYYTRWYGCAASRDYPLDVNDTDWDVPVPGAMNVSCGAPGLELTNDVDALKQRINDITTFGNTYIPAGLFWGWAVLSPEEPFSGAREYGAKIDGVPVQKVMVLMTDGANTRSPIYANGNHAGNDVTLANQRSEELCTNIKAKGIKIYTVAFEVADLGIKDILRDCASAPSNFFDADDSSELQTAFENIGANLSPLRIAR
jgi:Flp pilus assembly protein TadG